MVAPSDNYDTLPEVTFDDLTLEEKVFLLSGSGFNDTAGVARLGLPGTRVCDAATDVRGSQIWNAPASAVFPNATALAATWDTNLIRAIGREVAEEGKVKNIDVLLAPTVNLHRDPRAGRNQECYGEDPLLAGACAAAFIQGLQENGIQSCLKHLVCNDSETSRREYDVEVDDVTLREIYLRPFEMVIQQANPLAIMLAYNSIRGAPASHNAEVMDIVRKEWGYEGLFMSDWIGTYKTIDGLLAGMDIEMPFPMMRGPKLLQAVQQGDVQEDDLRPRVEKVLQYIRRANPPRQRTQERPSKYNAQRSALLRRTVGESVVLLKNQGGLLPLDVHQTKSIAVIGELATVSILPNLISPQYLVSPLDGIKGFVQLEAARCQINHAVGVHTHRIIPYLDERYTKQVEISIWKAKDRLEAGTGRQPYSTEVTGSAFKPMVGRHFPGLGGDFEIEMKAKIHVPKSGSYVLGLLTVGQAVVKLDEVTIMDHTPNRFVGIADMLFHQHEFQVEKVVQLEAGKQYNLHVVSQSQAGKSPELAQDLIVGMKEVVTNEAAIAEAVAAASKSDVAICFVGTGKDWEMEGFDRQTISLSAGQEEMVRQVAEANPNTIVVNQSGGAVDLMFAQESAKAVLHAHIGGQESGSGIADVLFGRVNPSSKLTFTVPSNLEDIATIDNFPCSSSSGKKSLTYREGRCFGYRWHDLSGRPKPLYPFGSGSSYTTFTCSQGSFTGSIENGFEVIATVTNTGSRAGREVIQVYVSKPSSLEQDEATTPVKTLEGFTKTSLLLPNSSETVSVALPTRAFASWSVQEHGWQVQAGRHKVLIARDAEQIFVEFGVDVKARMVVA